MIDISSLIITFSVSNPVESNLVTKIIPRSIELVQFLALSQEYNLIFH